MKIFKWEEFGPPVYHVEYFDKPEVFQRINGKWYPAKKIDAPEWKTRIKVAWLVFTGRVGVVVWPDDAWEE